MHGMKKYLFLLSCLAAMPPVVKSKSCTGLMVFKLAETGSTWFASLLQATPSYEIEEEIFTSAHADISGPDKTKKLKSVLNCETSKKPVQGFTINPKNNMGINWGHVAKATKARVVTWRRSNVVKTTVSVYRKSVQHVCDGKMNIKHNSSCVDKKVKLDADVFLKQLYQQTRFYVELDKSSIIASRNADGRNMSMYYEDMQEDQQREMDRLASFLGDISYSVKNVHGSTIKKTRDDLRDIIVNFDNILTELVSLKVPKVLNCPLAEMFQETAFKVYYGCNYEGLSTFLSNSGLNQTRR